MKKGKSTTTPTKIEAAEGAAQQYLDKPCKVDHVIGDY